MLSRYPPWVAGILLSLLLTASQTTYGLESVTPQSIVLTVFQDGAAVIDYRVAVDQSAPRVTFMLIGSNYDNVVVNSADGRPLDFRLDQNFITVDTVGEPSVIVTYTSLGLAKPSGALWTIVLDSPAPFRIIFPQEATIISVNQPPLDATAEETSAALTMPTGHSEISYTLAKGASGLDTFSPAARQPSGPISLPLQQGPLQLILVLAAILVVAAIIGVNISKRRKQKTASR